MNPKTPRDLLLTRHESETPHLDAARRAALAGIRTATPRGAAGNPFWRLRAFRPTAAGLFFIGATAALAAMAVIAIRARSDRALADPALTAGKLQESRRLQPASAETYYLLAVALSRAGRVAESEANIREALRLDPSYPEARDFLNQLQFAAAPPTEGESKAPADSRLPKTEAPARGARVAGEVVRPGAVSFGEKGSLPLSEAIAAAGGLTRLGNGTAVTVTRTLPNGTSQTFGPLDINSRSRMDPRTTPVPEFEVQPGDVVLVPPRIF